MRKTTKPVLEVAKLVSRFRRVMVEAQKAKTRILLCGTIPDPRPAVDSKLKLLDAALKDLDMGQGNNFLSMRATMLDARGQVRKDLYKPRGDVHLNSSGTKIASLRIRNMLEIMLPAVFPVQAPVQAQVQAPVAVPVVVNVPLVAAGVQQLVGQIQDLVVQNVTIVQPPVAMEVEGDNEILKRLFLQKFGRELPEQEPERNEVDDIVGNMDLIDLTNDDDEMEVATPAAVVVVVKTESIETPEAAPIDDRRRSSRLSRSLRKSEAIPEKEAPLAAGAENVVADADTDMTEDTSVGSVNTVNTEPLTADEAFEMAEAAIAESDAAIKANQMVIDGFYNTE
jgi:hypothetical protein